MFGAMSPRTYGKVWLWSMRDKRYYDTHFLIEIVGLLLNLKSISSHILVLGGRDKHEVNAESSGKEIFKIVSVLLQ